LWEILSILWEICYLIGIFRNHSTPPSTTILESFSGKFFLTPRAQSEKSGKFSSAPPNFFLPVRPWYIALAFIRRIFWIQKRKLYRKFWAAYLSWNGEIPSEILSSKFYTSVGYAFMVYVLKEDFIIISLDI
jgi:hypothetical protein